MYLYMHWCYKCVYYTSLVLCYIILSIDGWDYCTVVNSPVGDGSVLVLLC